MEGLQDIVGMKLFEERLGEALNSAYTLGIHRHSASRFEQYRMLLAEAASFSYPRPFPWDDDAEKRRLFFEAASQGQQLIDAAVIWANLGPVIAKAKVQTVLGGSVLPPKDQSIEDAARNTLFEFATARALHAKGFRVEMTASDEDIVAVYDGVPPFAVECKRPTHAGAMSRNVGKLRRQLVERNRKTSRLGMAGLQRTGGPPRSSNSWSRWPRSHARDAKL